MSYKDIQITSHPLKWKYLVETVERSGMENPDVYIEDVRDYGPCSNAEAESIDDGLGIRTDFIEASFSTICGIKNNRIIIRHHY